MKYEIILLQYYSTFMCCDCLLCHVNLHYTVEQVKFFNTHLGKFDREIENNNYGEQEKEEKIIFLIDNIQ